MTLEARQNISFEPLTEPWIDSAARLSDQAGWNQTEEDWRRLMRAGSSRVRVWHDEGEIRASYSIVGYGAEIAWIGMILVDERYRGMGVGNLAFRSALREADEGKYQTIGLDATDLGEPIYRKWGFETTAATVRWQGILTSPVAIATKLDSRSGLSRGVLEFDYHQVGFDRSELLSELNHFGVLLSIVRSSGVAAYAAVREGRFAAHIGPVVANAADDFLHILEVVAARYRGRLVVCDVVAEDAHEILRRFGLKESRHLKRMTLPRDEKCLRGGGIWCAAGLELG